MSMGPVAGAIVVWRCGYYFGSYDHVVSSLDERCSEGRTHLDTDTRQKHCPTSSLSLLFLTAPLCVCELSFGGSINALCVKAMGKNCT